MIYYVKNDISLCGLSAEIMSGNLFVYGEAKHEASGATVRVEAGVDSGAVQHKVQSEVVHRWVSDSSYFKESGHVRPYLKLQLTVPF